MRKLYSLCFASILSFQLMAGGIVTNSNQSAQWVRMMSRNASINIDAVYYNPAGLMRMDDGFHFAFNNQSVFQTKTISSTFPTLNQSDFVGDVAAPFFPTFFGVYKKDKIAISLGFGPNGGGGSATFEKGLPSFEMPASALPMLMTGAGIPTDQYSTEIYFEGSSIYYGTQLNFSYEFSDKISAGAGVRMINAANAYKGSIKNIFTNPMHPLNQGGMGNMTSTTAFFSSVSTAANQAATDLEPYIATGGAYTLDQLVGAGQLPQAAADMIAGGLGSNYDPSMTLAEVQGAYYYSGAVAAGYAAQTQDVIVDAEQSGMAFTPILSVNITPIENLDIAIKYEFNTALTLTNSTTYDYQNMFKNDSSFRADIPAILAIGVNYGISEKFRTQLSFTSYFDKQADWGGREDLVDNNFWELAIGFEYDIVESFSASAGWNMAKTGVSPEYQTDLSYSNSSNTIGFGGQYRIGEQIKLDAGAMFVVYGDYIVDTAADAPTPAYTTNYQKETWAFALGISYSF